MPEPKAYGLVPIETMLAQSGLETLQMMVDGRLPAPPIMQTLGFWIEEVRFGEAVVVGTPGVRHYHPMSAVHAGYAATLLDTAVACAVHTTLAPGEGYTTLELKLNLVRALTDKVGQVRVEGKVLHRGRSTATAEARMTGPDGRLYAHATTTCMIFPPGLG